MKIAFAFYSQYLDADLIDKKVITFTDTHKNIKRIWTQTK